LREKELRIALVCFGGASLAIYMHGITKEILKLTRASSALHSINDRAKRPTATFFDVSDRADPEYDTEAIYFELLREIGETVELRVIVDIVAGASAGGINGIMLARALVAARIIAATVRASRRRSGWGRRCSAITWPRFAAFWSMRWLVAWLNCWTKSATRSPPPP
jgi:predicted acylesterase/phospholipase RssA